MTTGRFIASNTLNNFIIFMPQKFLSITNTILFFGVIAILMILINFNNNITSLANRVEQIENLSLPMIIENSTKNEMAGAVDHVASPVKAKEIAGVNNLEINDLGFFPAEIKISSNKISRISVINSGKKPHSLVIDELNIDLGIIYPAETREFVIAQDFTESKSYVFYSNAEDDNPEIFKGNLIITK